MYVPKTLIIIFLIIGVTIYLNTNHPNNPAWQKIKSICGGIFLITVGVPLAGFGLGIWLSEQAGWDKNGWKAGLTTLFFGFGLPGTIVYVLGLLNVF